MPSGKWVIWGREALTNLASGPAMGHGAVKPPFLPLGRRPRAGPVHSPGCPQIGSNRRPLQEMPRRLEHLHGLVDCFQMPRDSLRAAPDTSPNGTSRSFGGTFAGRRYTSKWPPTKFRVARQPLAYTHDGNRYPGLLLLNPVQM